MAKGVSVQAGVVRADLSQASPPMWVLFCHVSLSPVKVWSW